MRPIAGTRPRGATPEEDRHLERELRADEKEKAEHVMLVDLGRNDLGRVCLPGSVKVGDYMSVDRYSHVMHLVSTVTGQLKPGTTAFDLVRATFPAGTVSGAPKIRAMEIIEELEPHRRGPYAGMVGYFDYSGNFDSAITIRTILAKEGRAYIQTGAGIVADSVAEREYQECKHKARALVRAVEMAQGGVRGGRDDDPAHRQLRLVHLQPRPVPPGAGARGHRLPQRRARARRDPQAQARGDRHLPRPRRPGPGRHLARGHPRAGREGPDLRRLPRPAVHRPGLRREDRARASG